MCGASAAVSLQRLALLSAEFGSQSVVLRFDFGDELPELRQLPDVVEERIAREQSIGTEPQGRGLAQPFHCFRPIAVDGVDGSDVIDEMVIVVGAPVTCGND